jgi:hypothetical protein
MDMINNKWKWKVRQVEAREYTAIFCDKNSLDTFSKISEIMLIVHGIKVKILKYNLDPDAVEVLQSTWVMIFGLPAIACNEDVVMKVATLA